MSACAARPCCYILPMMSENEIEGKGTGTEPAGGDSDDDLIRSTREMRFGQYRFVAFLIGLCLLMMLLSPIFNRYLEAYQAVVVAPPDGTRVLVITHDGMPRDKRVSSHVADELEVGVYLRKDNLAWNPTPITEEGLEPDPSVDDPDRQPPRLLPRLLNRYTAEWSATVTSISHRRLPTVGGRAGEQEIEYQMTLEMDDGATREMIVPDSLLPEGLEVLTAEGATETTRRKLEGARLEKRPLEWDPVIASPK